MKKSVCIAVAILALPLGGLALAQTGATNTPRSGVPGAPSQAPSYMWGASKAESEGFRVLTPGDPLQQRRASEAAAKAGVQCDVTSAALVREDHKGGVHNATYEVACKNDFGWIVISAGDKASAYECLALRASERQAKGKLATCRLGENLGSMAGLKNLTRKAGLSCTPVNGNYLGGGGTPAISRYEVLCDDGAGYIIDAPQPKSTAGMLVMSCARAKAAGMGNCALKPARG